MSKKSRGIPKYYVTVVMLFFFYVSYGLFQNLHYDLGSLQGLSGVEWLVPTDGIRYAILSYDIKDKFFQEQEFLDVIRGALNWATLPFLYGLIIKNSSQPGVWVVFINAFLIAFSYRNFFVLFAKNRISQWWFFALFILFQPYIFGYMLVLNKELIVLAAVPCIVSNLRREKWLAYTVSVLSVALFKVQIGLAGVLTLVIRNFGRRKTFFMLVAIGVGYPLLSIAGLTISMEEFLETAPERIRSADLMLMLESLAKFPFGALLVIPARIILNFFSGFNPERAFSANSVIDAVQSITTFMMSLLACLTVYAQRKRMKEFFLTKGVKAAGLDPFVLAFVLVLSFIPFLQSRYYWWTIPFFILILIKKIRR